jgi:N-acetylglucosamine-6-sulfatase
VLTRAAVALATALALGAGLFALLAGGASEGPPDRPNIVVVMTDDQDAASAGEMDNVQALLADEGTSFDHAYVSLPLCCPSRATFLTGRYAHNHGLRLAELEPSRAEYRRMEAAVGADSLPGWLQSAGYRTALVGKYLNGYGSYDPREVPAGWDEWVSPVGDESLYGFDEFTLNENGRLREYAGEYQTDVLSERAAELIESASRSADPFFLFVGYVAPHDGHGGPQVCQGSAQPAPRHAGALAAEELPRPTSFGEEDVSDKPDFVAERPQIGEEVAAELGERYRCRLESLLAVDEGVAEIVEALESASETDDTVIVFTSDNGYMLGEHRLLESKFFPYEEALRVPLIVRGAGGDPGATVEGAVSNVDLAPTILELADIAPGQPALDGVSLLPAINGEEAFERDLLFEGYYSNESTGGRTLRYYAGLRRGDFSYVEYRSGESELYDLAADPDQLQNMAGSPETADLERELSERLEALARCAGTSSRPVPGRPPCS